MCIRDRPRCRFLRVVVCTIGDDICSSESSLSTYYGFFKFGLRLVSISTRFLQTKKNLLFKYKYVTQIEIKVRVHVRKVETSTLQIEMCFTRLSQTVYKWTEPITGSGLSLAQTRCALSLPTVHARRSRLFFALAYLVDTKIPR